jgi:hypothetical protein
VFNPRGREQQTILSNILAMSSSVGPLVGAVDQGTSSTRFLVRLALFTNIFLG